EKTGILILNLGTPDAPTEEALYRYLKEFLGDPYVVDYPRWRWGAILNWIILRVRPAKSAALYREIWGEEGSPLLVITEAIAAGLAERETDWQIEVGMRYGNPGIRQGLEALSAGGVTHLVVLPLFPQYSTSTTETAKQAVYAALESLPPFEQVTFVEDYHRHPAYISALAESISETWSETGQAEKLLFSFHGVPERYVTRKGEPYREQCLRTAVLTAGQLGLSQDDYVVSFQSRFGPEKWLTPYTDEVLAALGAQGTGSLGVVCPGFAADCLETMEEINIQGREVYEAAGGKGFHYIPALNERAGHVEALAAILRDAMERL
ncbi:MAG: ferrochelatase, partial [Anaerolineales bacterium]